MSGLRTICKLYGEFRATDADGKTTVWVWDYAADEPCHRQEMQIGSARWKSSERAKAERRFKSERPL